MAAAAGGGGQTARRKKGGVVWAGAGGGGLLLLGGGILAATAALGVAFFVRAAIKRKGTAKGSSLQEAGQEQKRSTAACGREGVAEKGEERERIPPVLPPPPQLAALPPRQVEENSGSTATAGEAAAAARELDSARVEEKVIKETSLPENSILNEPKIIQVVGEAPPSAAAAAREEDEGSPVADGAEESSGEAGGSPPMTGAEAPEATPPAKATQPTLRVAKRVAMSIKEKVFVGGSREKKLGAEEAKAAWKEGRMAREMREKGVMDKMAVEMREKCWDVVYHPGRPGQLGG